MVRYRDIEAEFIKDFHDNKDYIELLKEYIGKSINENDVLLFSAHSIPQKFVDEGDPYVEQVKKTVELTASERKYYLSFQSRTGPVKWVGPDTISEAVRLTKNTDCNLFMVPIGFICDHIETLYEIDIELKGFVKENAGNMVRRMPMFNDDQRLGTALAKLIMERVTGADA